MQCFLKLPYPAFSINIPHNHLLTIRNELINTIYITEVLNSGIDGIKRKIEMCFVMNNDAMDHFQFTIEDGKDLIDQIEDQIFKRYQSKLAKRETNEIVSFLMATILYINSKEAVKQDIYASVLGKHNSRYPCCVLGYGIPIDRRMHLTRTQFESSRTMNTEKWTVRGHYRTYVKGEHWKEDSIIWIKPFLKGREKDNVDVPIKPSNYKVK